MAPLTNQMNALELARALLVAGTGTLVAVNHDERLVSDMRGVAPLMGWLESGVDLHGYSVADKVVGKGAALIYALLGPDAVFASVMSEQARAVLLSAGIATSYDELVDHIDNREKTGPCPIEEAVAGIFDPVDAPEAIRARLSELRAAADAA